MKLGICLNDTCAGRVICHHRNHAKPPQTLWLTTFSKERVRIYGLSGEMLRTSGPLIDRDGSWMVWIECSSYQDWWFFSFSRVLLVLTKYHTLRSFEFVTYKFETYWIRSCQLFKKHGYPTLFDCQCWWSPILFKVLPQLKTRATKHWFSLKEKPSVEAI